MRIALLVVIGFSSLASTAVQQTAAPMTVVTGYVRDQKNMGVANVRVSAMRAGNSVTSFTTGGDGHYDLKVPPAGPFDLAYESLGWQSSVMPGFSFDEKTQQVLTKLLLREGEILDERTAIQREFAEKYLATIRRGGG